MVQAPWFFFLSCITVPSAVSFVWSVFFLQPLRILVLPTYSMVHLGVGCVGYVCSRCCVAPHHAACVLANLWLVAAPIEPLSVLNPTVNRPATIGSVLNMSQPRALCQTNRFVMIGLSLWPSVMLYPARPALHRGMFATRLMSLACRGGAVIHVCAFNGRLHKVVNGCSTLPLQQFQQVGAPPQTLLDPLL